MYRFLILSFVASLAFAANIALADPPDVDELSDLEPQYIGMAVADAGMDAAISRVWKEGVVTTIATYGETDWNLIVYDTYAEDILGGVYMPEAVLTETLTGTLRPALCYIAYSMPPQPAANDYIDRIVGSAKEYGFPSWYIERLESFRVYPT